MLIKVVHGDDLRRIRFDPAASFEALKSQVTTVFKMSGEFAIKWKDEENDLITMESTADFKEAVSCMGGSTLRLMLKKEERGETFPGSRPESPLPSTMNAIFSNPPILDGTPKTQASNFVPEAVTQTPVAPAKNQIHQPQMPMNADPEEAHDIFQFLFGGKGMGADLTALTNSQELQQPSGQRPIPTPPSSVVQSPLAHQQRSATETNSLKRELVHSNQTGDYPPQAASTRSGPSSASKPKGTGKRKQGKPKSVKTEAKGNLNVDIGRRQARNRISAKRSRLRKESYMDSLKAANQQLEMENTIMRQYLQQVTGQMVFVGKKDIAVDETVKGPDSKTQGICLIRSLRRTEKSFVLTNAQQPDNPISYASDHFFRLTLYTQPEVLGRNCRFLQGPLTSGRSVLRIRQSIAKGQDVACTFVNYKKNKKPFWNQLFIFPLRDDCGRIANFIGIQAEVQNQEVVAQV